MFEAIRGPAADVGGVKGSRVQISPARPYRSTPPDVLGPAFNRSSYSSITPSDGRFGPAMDDQAENAVTPPRGRAPASDDQPARR